MRARIAWFVAGSAAGVYATAKARRAAYRVSMPGLIDQAAALGQGWRAFAGEVREGMTEAEAEVAARLDRPLPPTDHRLELPTERDHP